MKSKIPQNILRNFLSTHFEIKSTHDEDEVRVNSIYQDDQKQHCYINIKNGVFSDFKSNVSGSIYKLIGDFLQITEEQVFITLIKEYSSGKDLKEFKIAEVIRENNVLLLPNNITFFSEKPDGIIRNKAFNYLLKRKISKEVINTLGYIFEDGNDFDRRIFIPFYENNQIVYFLARDFFEETVLRYKNPKGLNSKEFVYNLDKIEDEVVICEGVFDAMSLDNQIATCMMSADLGRIQISKICDKGIKRIIFCPDNDKTGQETLDRNIKLFMKYKPASIKTEILVYNLPEGIKDLNELKEKTGKNFLEKNDCEVYKKKIMFVMKKSTFEA